jgi:hypothetical protein
MAGRCCASPRARGVAVRAGGGQPLFVALPQLGLVGAQVVQVGPGEDAGVVAVGEARLHRVVADGRHLVDADVALAGLQHFLPRSVTLHLGRRRVHAHQLERDAELRAVVERDFQHARGLVNGQRDRLGFGFRGGHVVRRAIHQWVS